MAQPPTYSVHTLAEAPRPQTPDQTQTQTQTQTSSPDPDLLNIDPDPGQATPSGMTQGYAATQVERSISLAGR